MEIAKQNDLIDNKKSKKKKIKGCACYGVNSIHPCFCSPFSNKKCKSNKK